MNGEEGAPGTKRIRIGFEGYAPAVGTPSQTPGPHAQSGGIGGGKAAFAWTTRSEPPHRPTEDLLRRAWITDPYVTDPQPTITIISSFFARVEPTGLGFLPEAPFKAWVQSKAHRKSADDMMLLYSVLAVGVALSDAEPEYLGEECALVAKYATANSKLSLQLVQARILLSLYYLIRNESCRSIETSASAISASICLGLNLELDESQESLIIDEIPYGLSLESYKECRRRTLWGCFMYEKLDGSFPTRLCELNAADIFVRLPCSQQAFDSDEDGGMPLFEVPIGGGLMEKTSQPLSLMAECAQITAIWTEVMSNIYRMNHCRPSSWGRYMALHRPAADALRDWENTLPRRHQLTADNLREAIQAGESGSMVGMHLVYHSTAIKLHRHLPVDLIAADLRRSYLLVARNHARRILEIVRIMDEVYCAGRTASRGAPATAGTPATALPPAFCSLAILEAMDVLCAEGAAAELPGLIADLGVAERVMALLGTVWGGARFQRTMIENRIAKLGEIREHAEAGAGDELAGSMSGCCVFVVPVDSDGGGADNSAGLAPGTYWQVSESLDRRFKRDLDLVFGCLTKRPVV